MSIAILVQVFEETRRLAVAGSAVAPGDFRLKKLIPALEQAGQKAPVFAKVGQAVQAVVESNEKTAASALLDLTTLVHAILYTQGETGMAGDFKALETRNLGGEATQTSARVLKPLLEALSSTGSGRLELIRDASERGAFKDLRLVKPALGAIDDPYPEIGVLIAERVLPLYGKAILPELRGTLKIKERGGGHQNRLKLMHKLDPQGSREVVQLTLNEGSKEMKVVAIECLGTTDEDVNYLLEQARAKAKDVRTAALRALTASGLGAKNVVAAIQKAIQGEDLELFVDRVRTCAMAEIQEFVLAQAGQQLAEALKSRDKKEQGAAMTRMQHLVGCLEGRTDAGAEGFLLKCFDHAKALAAIKSEPSGADLNETVARVLARGTPAMQEKLVAARATLTGGMFASAAIAGRALLSPAEFYATFSPWLKEVTGKKRKETDRGVILTHILMHNRSYYHRAGSWFISYGDLDDDSGKTAAPALDARWLDAALETEDVDLVCELARPGHAGVNKFLSRELAGRKKANESSELLRTMVRIGHPEAVDAVIANLKKLGKDTSYYYVGYWYGEMIAGMPRSALPRFEELLPTLPDRMVDQLMDSVLALKNKPE